LWAITERLAAIAYRRFGKNYRSHLQWSKFLTIEGGTNKL